MPLLFQNQELLKSKQSTVDINLPDYSYELFPTESSTDDTLLYIGNHLSYKLRKDLSIYKSCQIESTFIEISNPKKNNIVIGCIYKYPNMNLNEFNSFNLNDLLDKPSKEKKTVLLLGEFNINLLNYDQDTSAIEFLDFLSSRIFLLQMI